MTGLLFVFLSATLISQSFMDAMSVVIVLYMLIMRFTRQTRFSPLFSNNSALKELGFFGLWLVVIAIGVRASPHWLKNLSEWKWILNLIFMYWFLNHYLTKRGTPSMTLSFWQPLYWVLIACFIYGAISYATGVDLFKQQPLTHGQRFAGPFDDPMNFAHIYGMYAAFLVPFVLEALSEWKHRNKKTNAQKLLVAAFTVTAISVALTLTRGAWAGLSAAIFLTVFIYRKRLGLAIAGIGTASALLLYVGSATFKNRVDQAFNPSQSYDSERYNLWRTNLEIFKDYPVFGIGHGDYMAYLPSYFAKLGIPTDHFQSHAHNQYLQFLSNTGLVGFLFYMIFILGLLILTYKQYRKHRDPIFLGSIGAQVAFHIGSLTECNFERAKVRLVFLFFCALALSVAAQLRAAKKTS
jgi:O-antigen ligase